MNQDQYTVVKYKPQLFGKYNKYFVTAKQIKPTQSNNNEKMLSSKKAFNDDASIVQYEWTSLISIITLEEEMGPLGVSWVHYI